MSKRPKEDLSATDPDKKKPEVLAKSKHFKLFNLSDVLKPTKHLDHSIEQHPKRAGLTKSMTQTTLEYFFRHSAGKNQVYANTNHVPKKKILHKQNSIGSYPIRIEVTDEDDRTKSQEKLEVPRDSDALALERPRKKLSFKIPEISTAKQGSKNKSGSYGCISKLVVSPQSLPGLPRNSSFNGILHKGPSCEDWDLESQAMRVVRTIGQAFEVCHKLSINAPPENENLEQDEQETLTQDLLSDRLSDINSDKPKRDLISEGASDRMSLPPDDCGSFRDLEATSCFVGGGKGGAVRPSPHIDVLPPPPNHNPKKSSLTSAETYAAPHSDALPATASVSVINSSGRDSISLPIGGALSAHHELQLMREQLDQQQQQTREALSQLQLVREQLAAEQSARLEAQARTHQLLIHNRELLDHIAALVAHLQGGDKPGQQPTPPHMTMPQHLVQSLDQELPQLDGGALLHALGLTPQHLIENMSATSGGMPPPSPMRGGAFTFAYPPPLETIPPVLESHLLQQRLQALGVGLPYGYSQALLASLYKPQGVYNLQSPPQKKGTLGGFRNSYPGGTTVGDVRVSPGRSSEPRQVPGTPQYQTGQMFQFNNLPTQYQYQTHYQNQSYQYQPSKNVEQKPTPSFLVEENPSFKTSQPPEEKFIKPLPQMGTLTTTDPDGRLRVIVPVPSNGSDDTDELLANLKITDTLKPSNGPAITRSTSEKVPNRSELMSQVHRTAWARHTTK